MKADAIITNIIGDVMNGQTHAHTHKHTNTHTHALETKMRAQSLFSP